LAAARAALARDPDVRLLDRLDAMLARRTMPAREQLQIYRQTGSVVAALQHLGYD
jgi:hypothetical protein